MACLGGCTRCGRCGLFDAIGKCPECGAEMPPRERTCSQCGYRFPPPPGTPMDDEMAKTASE